MSESAGEAGKMLFLQEIEFMKQIGSHRNVLSMLGYWVKSEPIMSIMEYVPHGDLLQWLRNKREVRQYITIKFISAHLNTTAFYFHVSNMSLLKFWKLEFRKFLGQRK